MPVVSSNHPASAAEEPVQAMAAASANKPAAPGQARQMADADIVFLTLSAEVAIQRGQWQTGYLTLLDLANRVQDPRFARRATEIAISARSQKEAITASQTWLSLAPDSEEALQNYVSLLVVSNNIAELQQLLSARLRAAPPARRGETILRFQQYLSHIGNPRVAFSVVEQITTLYDTLPETHLARALAAYANKDVGRTRTEASKALAAMPDSERAVLLLARTAGPEEELKLMADFLARYPKSSEVRLSYARRLVEKKQYAAALAEFETLHKHNPDDRQAMYATGILLIQLKQWDKADNQLQRYLQTLPVDDDSGERGQIQLLLSQVAEERQDMPRAIYWLDQITPGDNYAQVQVRKANLTLAHQGLQQARSVLSQARNHSSNEPDTMLLAQTEANMLRDKEMFADAASVLKLALREYPENTHLLYDYAMVAEQRRDYVSMEGSLRKIIKLSPSMHHAYNALGYSLAERNIRLKEALALIEKANQLSPNDPFITDSLGWVHFRLGNLDKAETLLRHAYALRPDAEIAIHLGEVLWKRRKNDEALSIWRDVQKKDPANVVLNKTLQRLKAAP